MVPPLSMRIPRARMYSGSPPPSRLFAYRALTLFRRPSHAVLLKLVVRSRVLTPKILLPPVWPLPISLAATLGISFDFSSCAYLDVSLRRVPRTALWIHAALHGSSP